LQRPEERAGLLAELECRWGLRQLSPTEQNRLRARATSLTAAEIENAVEMSRRLRENTRHKPNAMSREERLACLRQTRERFCARRQDRLPATAR